MFNIKVFNKIKALLFVFAFLFSINNAAFADFSFNDMELKFAQVSDTHISDAEDTSYKVLSHSKALLDAAISDINNLKGLDFVVFTGDLVNEPSKKSYRDFFVSLTKLDYPAILALGNHDSFDSQNNNDLIDKKTAYEIIKRSNPYQNYGAPYFAFSPNKEYRVIVLDTTKTDNSEALSVGYLPEEQLNFLDNEISNNQDKIILIFQHHPVIEPFKSNSHKLLNAEEYLNILKKYEKVPIAIFSGHYHAARITRKGNVIHCSSPSLVTYPNAYRFVTVTNYNDRVIFEFVFRETKLKNVQELSKAGLIATTAFAGTSSDRNEQIMIRKGYVPKEKLTKEEKAVQKQEQKALKKANKKSKKNKNSEVEQ